jgi:hypothetical protein
MEKPNLELIENETDKKVNDFLKAVFRNKPDDAHILTFTASNGISLKTGEKGKGKSLGYPNADINVTLKTLARSTDQQQAYFGTGAMRPKESTLYNRQSDFEGMYVLVLDDIGTAHNSKCSVDDLPEALKSPSYIIASSPDNHQYGFILEEPIRDLNTAKEFVRRVYDAGKWDSGGKMPNKIVRLPVGYHKTGAAVEMKLFNPERRFTYTEILDAVGVTESQMDKKQQRLNKVHRILNQQAYFVGGHNLVDQVMEDMAKLNWILQDGGDSDWTKIECPWAYNHTSGDNSAGYSPLGSGEGRYAFKRGFNCFHEHCQDKSTVDFLAALTEHTGHEYGIEEPAAELLRDYVYYRLEDKAVEVKTGIRQSIQALRNDKAGTFKQVTAEGTIKHVSKVAGWLNSPSRRNIEKAVPMPAEDDILVETDEGLVLNTYQHPDHRLIEPDMEAIKPFFDFIKYLIPITEEREYFQNWLAMGLQDPYFRGAAMFMVATAQGTGRNSLAKIMFKLFGEANSALVEFSQIGADFNTWRINRLVFFPEVLDNDSRNSKYAKYEKVKESIDPVVQPFRYKEKYQKEVNAMCHTMTFMATNHADAMAKIESDRRLYMIQNPNKAESPAFFKALYAWMAKPEEWLDSLYSYYMKRDVSSFDGYAEAPMTQAKANMQELNRDMATVIGQSLLNWWGEDFYPVNVLANKAKELARHYEREQGGVVVLGSDSPMVQAASHYVKKRAIKLTGEKGHYKIGSYRVASQGGALKEGFDLEAVRKDVSPSLDDWVKELEAIPISELLAEILDE